MNVSVGSLWAVLDRLDEKAIWLMSRYGILALRISLGVIFVWFGVLKVIGDSPVYDLVASTVYLVPPEFFVPFLGFWEIAVGL